MARYKYIDTSPRFIAIDLQRQLLPGTFEHAVVRVLIAEEVRPHRVPADRRARITAMFRAYPARASSMELSSTSNTR